MDIEQSLANENPDEYDGVMDFLDDTALQRYILDNSITGLACDPILNQQSFQTYVDPNLFAPDNGFDQPNAFSTDSLTDNGSIYSVGYSSPHGSTDSGIRSSIDLDSPISPMSDENGMTYNFATNTSELNTNQIPMSPLLQENTQQYDTLMKQLQEQIAFYQTMNNDKLKDHLQKQQEQQKLLQNQLIFNLQQKMVLERNVNLTAVQVQAPVVALSSPDLAASKENNLRKMIKNNLGKTKNNLITTIQETTGKMKCKVANAGNKLGKRKLPPVAPAVVPKVNKLQIQDAYVDLEEAKATVNDLQRKNLTTSQNPTLASLLLQPKIERAKEQLIVSSEHMVSVNSPPPLYTLQQVQSEGLVSATLTSQHHSKKGGGGSKKTRVEHVVIEKRYRMKITESLKELKHMLGCYDEKKSTKNAILQCAIIEIKKLRRENNSLKKKGAKMRKLFGELKSIGIIPASQQTLTSDSGSSDASERSSVKQFSVEETTVEPEINQEHYVSPFSRQSARDGAKTLTCFAMFLFLFITPFNLMTGTRNANGATYSSRHLLSVLDQDAPSSPQYFLLSKVIHVLLSVFCLMFMVLHGNPRCAQDSKIVLCFKGQLRKAQLKINKKNYDDAKGFLRIALFIIGNSCPKTLYGQWASFLWKCICHILYQLGILSILDSMGKLILPSMFFGIERKKDQDFTAKHSVKAYTKLHEIALKDPSSTYLEAACYLMNAVHSAEVSGDQELIATAYTTAVIHMREKVKFCSYILQYYFTSCAHHASLLSQDTHPYAVDWIFERYGYDFFACGKWNVNKQPAFNVTDVGSDLDEADLHQTVYAQFQDHTLTKALKRMVLPEAYYPNEGKIELRLRALSILDTLGTGPPSEQIDSRSLFHQAVYGWWKCSLNNLVLVLKNEAIDWADIETEEDYYQDIHEVHRSELIILSKSTFATFMAIQQLKNNSKNIQPQDLFMQCDKMRWKLLEASELLSAVMQSESRSDNEQLQELIQIMCCNLLVDASHTLWSLDESFVMTEQELNLLTQLNEMLHCYSLKYSELVAKVQHHDYQIQSMSGTSQHDLTTVLKRSNHMKFVRNQTNELNSVYFITQNYPLKQDGFVRK